MRCGASRGRPPSSAKCAPRNAVKWGLKLCSKLLPSILYYAYILKLINNSYYHGSSSDIQQRLQDHERGIVKSTKDLRPVKLVFYAAFATKIKAVAFEKYLKSSSGHAFRNKRLIEGIP
jgi:putative endonuclease